MVKVAFYNYADCQFRIPGRPRTSACLLESEGNVGHFSPRRQTNMTKLRLLVAEKSKICNVERFQRSQNLLLRNHCFK